MRSALILLTCLALLPMGASAAPAAAGQLRIVRTIKAQPGLISDAALQHDGVLYLCYPEAGHIAQYSAGGKLLQDIIREAGVSRPFRPTTCVITSGSKLASGGLPSDRNGEALQVFDEAEHQVWLIGSDGNTASGIDLAYPSPAGSLALSRIGQLLTAGDKLLWALLPDRGKLCSFDSKGALQSQLDLTTLLPYNSAIYARAQYLGDGSLFVLDYNQGAVLYRRGPEGAFRRLAVDKQAGLDGAPTAQDFAADEQGNVLLLTTSDSQPAVLMTRTSKGYVSHKVNLPFPGGAQRLACRFENGQFIVWSRETGIVVLCEAQ